MGRLFSADEFREMVPAPVAPAIVEQLDRLRRTDVVGSTRIVLDHLGELIEDEIDTWGDCDPPGVRILTPGRNYQSEWDDLVETAIDGYEFVFRDRAKPSSELMQAD